MVLHVDRYKLSNTQTLIIIIPVNYYYYSVTYLTVYVRVEILAVINFGAIIKSTASVH